MNRIQLILKVLKPKVKAFGFNWKELKGIAARIADDLTSAEDASEEDVMAEIEERIEVILPYLQFSQSYANRIAEDVRKRNEDDEPDDDRDEGRADTQGNGSQSGSKARNNANGKNDETPEWAKSLLTTVTSLSEEISKIKSGNVARSRKSRLEELLKDSGKFGSGVLRSFERMKFDNDEDFEDFFSGVEEDLKAYNQERADEGLSTMKTPPLGGKGKGTGKDEPFSDDDIEKMAEGF